MYEDKIYLNGDDWIITGWWENQWRFFKSMETGQTLNAPVGPVAGKVPGAVQRDLIREGLLPDPDYGLNSCHGEWVNNREWFYDKEFKMPEEVWAEKFLLVFKGLDFCGEIHLNGTMLAFFSGMFTPVELDVTNLIRPGANNCLRVVFYRSPEVYGQFGYSNRINILKSRFNYIWDWCPRIVPVGIWDDVYIKIHSTVRIVDFHPETYMQEDKRTGMIHVHTDVDAASCDVYEFEYKVSRNGTEMLNILEEYSLIAARQVVEKELALMEAEPWWPCTHGEQPLYDIDITVRTKDGQVCDRAKKRIGFRKAEFVSNDGSPKGARPYTLVLNGKRIFLKGVNWVPISPFYGCVSKDEYSKYLQRFRDMNCNLLRVWGGAILEKQDFYDLCDELGLMVWQEFPQSSSGLNNTPPDGPDLLEELEQVAKRYILEKRHHACHILWCGGNELMWEGFIPVDERHGNIKMLKSLVEKLDKGKYFLSASASGPRFQAAVTDMGKGVHHDVHGPWNYLGNVEQYSYFNLDDSLFRSETGCPGSSRIETLEKYQLQYKIWPPDRSNRYWVHRGAWWLQKEELSRLFGDWDNEAETEKYIKSSRFIQAEALRYAAEATRRREPEASGFIVWMGNEPFPNNVNTSVIEYDGTPKPAYYWLRNAFSRLHVSAKYERINYSAGDTFKADIFITSEEGVPKDMRIGAELLDVCGGLMHQINMPAAELNNKIEAAACISWKVRTCKYDMFLMRLRLYRESALLDENIYIFTVNSEHPFEPLRVLPECSLQLGKASDVQNGWIIKNNSSIAAFGIFLYGKNPDDFLGIFPNYFTLMPGEEKTVYVEGDLQKAGDELPFKVETYNSQNF